MERIRGLWIDHPMKSLDRAIWWIEYVIRHKGTKHLRSATVDISWTEYMLIDVCVVLILLVFTVIFICKKIVYGILLLCRNRKEKQQ